MMLNNNYKASFKAVNQNSIGIYGTLTPKFLPHIGRYCTQNNFHPKIFYSRDAMQGVLAWTALFEGLAGRVEGISWSTAYLVQWMPITDNKTLTRVYSSAGVRI